MDRPTKTRLVKVAIFAGFVACILAIGVWSANYGNPPTKWDGKPFSVTPLMLSRYGATLEGKQVALILAPKDVSYNASTDTLSFAVVDETHGITIGIVYPNWSKNGLYTEADVASSGEIAIEGISHVATSNTIVATALHVVGEETVYWASAVGGIAMLAVLFWYFRLDLRHLRFVVAKKHDRKEESQDA
jgi:hypothetical protein